MELVYLVYLLLGVVVGFCLGLLSQWAFHRRILKAEYALADLEQDMLSEKRKRAVGTRWKNAENDEALLRAVIEKAAPKEARFANDPELWRS